MYNSSGVTSFLKNSVIAKEISMWYIITLRSTSGIWNIFQYCEYLLTSKEK
jgi:hypothetical protein